MSDDFGHTQDDEPVPGCDCHRCALHARNQARAELGASIPAELYDAAVRGRMHMREALRAARLEIKRLIVERDHWRANHADMVQRARVLIDRPDMPIERVQAFQQIGELQEARAALTAEVEQLRATAKEAAH